jgi:31-O-methyltransferase
VFRDKITGAGISGLSRGYTERLMIRRLSLPDGLEVFSLNADETRFVHREVFGSRCYLQHGISLTKGDCVFDVGANIGLATIFFHRECEGVRIFAFEPSPRACECLRANIELHGADARVFECGLSSVRGTAEFTFYPANSVMSGFHADVETDRTATKTYMVNSGVAPTDADRLLGFKFKKTSFLCPLRTLSDVVDEEGVPRIDLLKVDVEKSERDVLGGIRGNHWGIIRQAVIEVHDENGALHEVQELLAKHGFELTIEQDPLLKGTNLCTVFASRRKCDS